VPTAGYLTSQVAWFPESTTAPPQSFVVPLMKVTDPSPLGLTLPPVKVTVAV
jgi:hypothetical protein